MRLIESRSGHAAKRDGWEDWKSVRNTAQRQGCWGGGRLALGIW